MIRVSYLGWSGFLLDGDGTRIALDPHWSTHEPVGSLPAFDLTPLSGIVVSHGHPDHVGDVPVLLRLHPKAWVVGSPAVAQWLVRQVPEAASRIVSAPPGEPITRGGVTIRLLPGVHVGEGVAPQLARLVRYARRAPLATAALVSASVRVPRHAPVCSVTLRMPDGTRVLHAAETAHRASSPRELDERAADGPVDVFLLGVEPGEEAACRAQMLASGSKRTVVFSPHEASRARFGEGGRVGWSALLAAGAERAQPYEGAAP